MVSLAAIEDRETLRQRLTFQLAYTWSKQMDAIEFLNAADPLPYETISGGDRTHRIAASGIVELPFGKGRKFASDLPALGRYLRRRLADCLRDAAPIRAADRFRQCNLHR